MHEHGKKQEGIRTGMIETIVSHYRTTRISKPDMPGPWVYASDLFPCFAETIDKTIVYKNESRLLFERLGIPAGVGGFFVRASSTIVVCGSRGVPDDVIILHEMLHYVSQLAGNNFLSMEPEENFVFSNSVRYLAETGRSREWIARKYMLPYYASLAMSKAKKKANASALKAEALLFCERMISEKLDGLPKVEDDDTEIWDLI